MEKIDDLLTLIGGIVAAATVLVQLLKGLTFIVAAFSASTPWKEDDKFVQWWVKFLDALATALGKTQAAIKPLSVRGVK